MDPYCTYYDPTCKNRLKHAVHFPQTRVDSQSGVHADKRTVFAEDFVIRSLKE